MCSPAAGLGRSVGPYALAWPGALGCRASCACLARWVGSHLLAVRGSGAAWALVNWPGVFAWRGGRGSLGSRVGSWGGGSGPMHSPGTMALDLEPEALPRERGLPGPMHPKIVAHKVVWVLVFSCGPDRLPP